MIPISQWTTGGPSLSRTGKVIERGTVYLELGESMTLPPLIEVEISEHAGLIDHAPQFGPGVEPESVDLSMLKPRFEAVPFEIDGSLRQKSKYIIDALPKPGQYLFWRERLQMSIFDGPGILVARGLQTLDLHVRWLIDVQLAELSYVLYYKEEPLSDEH